MTTHAAAGNRLAAETSPYLRQHANNPVAWHPWGPDALAKAKSENKPIFLSIGYSACHWCHVMEHESFEDPAIAALLNRDFINIKVDREERPDIDQIYMSAVVAMTRHGGWPMSVFLTPELEPFFAGTYFPPQDRHGLPSFRRVIEGVADAWKQRPEDLKQSASQIAGHLRAAVVIEPVEMELNADILRQAVRHLEHTFDDTYGGFGRAPKFPHPLELKLLLRTAKRFDDEDALRMAEVTLDHMARGGIYDQLGGGFARYSTDATWLVPHFEKMLYDNALLAQVYLEAYLVTGKPFYSRIVQETLHWVAEEMTHPQGGFYSALDADSEGIEGKYYVWTEKEVHELLGEADGEFFCSVFDVSDTGNWEGHNILHRPRNDEQESRWQKLSLEELQTRIQSCKQRLLAARSRRIPPGRDDKILTAWNGLMIAAHAQAAACLEGVDLAPAANAARFILAHMRQPDGRLYRTASAAGPAKLNAYLEDYAFFVDGLLHLYEASLEETWLREAIALTDVMILQFWDESAGGFFFVGKDHETLIVRGKDQHDNAVPAGNSLAVLNLLRLSAMLGRNDWAEKAERTLRLYAGNMQAAPTAFGQMLCALDFHLGPVTTYVIAGGKESGEAETAARLLRMQFQPHRIILRRTASNDTLQSLVLQNIEPVEGEVTIYTCRGTTCDDRIVGIAAVQRHIAAKVAGNLPAGS